MFSFSFVASLVTNYAEWWFGLNLLVSDNLMHLEDEDWEKPTQQEERKAASTSVQSLRFSSHSEGGSTSEHIKAGEKLS